MSVKNGDVAEIFEEMADLLEIDEANAFRVRAYRDAARLIGGMGDRVADRVATGDDLTRLTGIGDDLAGKIREIVETGKLSELEAVRERVPPSLRELMQIEGLGAKKVRALWKSLNITDLKGLLWAAETEKIREVSGFGKRTEEKILEAAKELEDGERRFLRPKAEEIGEPLLDYLRNLSGVRTADIAGSYRRGKETVGDLDILIIRDEGAEVMGSFVEYEDVERIVSRGDTRSTVVLRGGMHVDLRVVAPESYGAALHYFTGSKAHSVSLRKRANGKGLKINEYGVFRDEERIAGETEAAVFEAVDLAWIPPELREDRGEIDAAAEGNLPALLSLDDIRGDLHCHTDETDGRAEMKEMVEAARKRGYAFLAISDHTQNVTVANGMDEKRLRKQLEAIDRLNDELDDFVILKAAEVDILKDGTLDLPDSVLQELDFRVCSIHSKFNLSREEQTERILKAMDNPMFTILGHPTGRLLNTRKPYEVDMEAIIRGAAERGCFLELNAHFDRLDLNDAHCRMAKDAGVKVAISTDAHAPSHLAFMRYGVDQARRGWLEKGDVVNTRGVEALRALFRR